MFHDKALVSFILKRPTVLSNDDKNMMISDKRQKMICNIMHDFHYKEFSFELKTFFNIHENCSAKAL